MALGTKFLHYDISNTSSYPGSGNTVFDLTANNNDLTLYNGPTFSGTGNSKYIKFDGVNDYAVGTGFSGLGVAGIANTFSRFVWCQLDNVSASQWMTSLGYYGPPDYAVTEDLFSTPSGWQWTPNYGANVSQINAGAIGQSVWVNLGYVADTTNLYAYVNGVQVGSFSGNTKAMDLSGGYGFCISGYLDKYTTPGVFNFALPFDGKIASIEYYNGAATALEVNNYYRNTYKRFGTNILCDYDFDDPSCYSGSGNTVYDLQGNINLSLVGTPTWVSGGPGGSGNYFSFNIANASSNHLASSSSALLNGSFDFSYAFVVQPRTYSSGNNECYAGITSPTYNYQYGMNFGKADPDLTWNYIGDNQLLPSGMTQNKWYVVVVTFDQTNDTMKVYRNGVLLSTLTPLTQNPFSFVNALIQLGYNGLQPGNPGTSYIKRFTFWKNAVLTQADVEEYSFPYSNLLFTPVLDLNASESASASGSGATWYDLAPSGPKDFTMYNPSFTAPVSGTNPGYFSFPSRNYTDPLTVYGEYLGTPSLTQSNNFTGYFWVRRNANHGSYSQNRCPILANGREDFVQPPTDNGWAYGSFNNPTHTNNNLTLESATYGAYEFPAAITDAVWEQVAMTVDSSNVMRAYINGVYAGQVTGYSFNTNTPAESMWISRTASNLFSWMGDISIVRQYDTALSGTAISLLYNYDYNTYINTSGPPPTPYVGLVGGRTFGMGFAG